MANAGPLVATARAARVPWTDLEGATFDLEGVALGQGPGHLAAGPGDDALKRGTRDAHAPGCLLLGEAFQVSQPQGFQLLLKEGCTA